MKNVKKVFFTALLLLSLCGVLTGCAFLKFPSPPSQQPIPFNLIYHLNGGRPDFNTEIVDDTYSREVYLGENSTFSPLDSSDVLKDTWIFGGWYLDEQLSTPFTAFEKGNTADVHLWAKWIDKVTVTKDNFTDYFTFKKAWNGGLTTMNAAVEYSFTPKYLYDSAKSPDEVIIQMSYMPKVQISLGDDSDYSFASARIGFSAGTTVGAAIASVRYTVLTEQCDLYLLHRDPIAVTLNLDGGEGLGALSITGGEKLSPEQLPTPTKDNYRFIGWFFDSEFTKGFKETQIRKEITLYAKWTKIVTVDFNTSGGSAKDSLQFLEGDDIVLGENPTKDGLGFFGWYTDAQFTTAFDQTKATTSLTLYARWEPYRTITFDTKGGSAKAPLETLNTAVPILGNEPTKAGMLFRGWFKDNGFTQKYTDTPQTEDLTLYAYWCYKYDLSGLSDEFFDISVNMDKASESNTMITTVTVKLKERYSAFAHDIYVEQLNVEYIKADGILCGNFLTGSFVLSNTSENPKDEFVVTDRVHADYSAYHNTDHCSIASTRFFLGWIEFPEGYTVGA